MATFNIQLTYENQPPTIGDYSTLTSPADTAETIVLTRAMFTTDTSPAYSDPEGDAPSKLRIDTLPSIGEIQLSGTAVTAGQEIDFSDIDANNLTYVNPGTETAQIEDDFTFSISDVGSGLFSS